MKIAVGSLFRDATWYLDRYLAQVNALRRHVGPNHPVRVIAVEGDSVDDTREQLLRCEGFEVVKHDHGGPHFGSVEDPRRFEQLSPVANTVFEHVRDDDDVFLFVESDLVWDPHQVGSCIDVAFRCDENFDVVAPLVFAGECFYDVWGFRGLDGSRFGPFSPYHHTLNGSLTEVSSVGSCLAMRGAVARACRIRNNYCLVGWCEDARNQGFRIGVHPGFRVFHP